MGLLPQPLSREAVTLLSASFYRLWKKQPGHVAGGPGGLCLRCEAKDGIPALDGKQAKSAEARRCFRYQARVGEDTVK